MLGLRKDVIWLFVLVMGLGILGISTLASALPYLLQGSFDAGVAVALILGLTATLLAISALAQAVAVIIVLLRQRDPR